MIDYRHKGVRAHRLRKGMWTRKEHYIRRNKNKLENERSILSRTSPTAVYQHSKENASNLNLNPNLGASPLYVLQRRRASRSASRRACTGLAGNTDAFAAERVDRADSALIARRGRNGARRTSGAGSRTRLADLTDRARRACLRTHNSGERACWAAAAFAERRVRSGVAHKKA